MEDSPHSRTQGTTVKTSGESQDGRKEGSSEENRQDTTWDLIVDGAKKTCVHGMRHILAARNPTVAMFWSLVLATALGKSLTDEF